MSGLQLLITVLMWRVPAAIRVLATTLLKEITELSRLPNITALQLDIAGSDQSGAGD
jgi:hypothetical protein